MKTSNEISQKLRELDTRHCADGDGGYGLLGRVVQYARTLNVNDKDLLRRELIRLVDSQDQTLWGVALEALVHEWNLDISTELESLLRHEHRTCEFESHILMALLRLHFEPIATKAITHISKRIAADDRTVLPLIAALSKVDVDNCMKMAVPFLVRIARDGQIEKLTGYIPAIVSHFLDTDSNLLPLLIRKTAVENREVAFQVARLLHEYVDRPYVIERLGKDATEHLQNQLNAEFADQ